MNKYDNKIKDYLEQPDNNKSIYLTIKLKNNLTNDQIFYLKNLGLINYFKNLNTATCRCNKEQIFILNNNELVIGIVKINLIVPNLFNIR